MSWCIPLSTDVLQYTVWKEMDIWGFQDISVSKNTLGCDYMFFVAQQKGFLMFGIRGCCTAGTRETCRRSTEQSERQRGDGPVVLSWCSAVTGQHKVSELLSVMSVYLSVLKQAEGEWKEGWSLKKAGDPGWPKPSALFTFCVYTCFYLPVVLLL